MARWRWRSPPLPHSCRRPQWQARLQDRGDFGGTWTYIGPSDHYHWRYADAYLDAGPPVLVAPPYVEGPPVYDPGYYGPPVYQDEAPGLTVVTPDVGIAVGID